MWLGGTKVPPFCSTTAKWIPAVRSYLLYSKIRNIGKKSNRIPENFDDFSDEISPG
jgi:hypothetical protein